MPSIQTEYLWSYGVHYLNLLKAPDLKSFILNLVLCTFTLAHLGLPVNVHMCMGKKSFEVFGLSLGKGCFCNHTSEHHKHDCCKDKDQWVKVKEVDKHTPKTLASLKPKENLLKTFFTAVINLDFEPPVTDLSLHAKAPPGHDQPPVYLVQQVFRI